MLLPSTQQGEILGPEGGLDLRGVPPSKGWQRLLSGNPSSEELRAWLKELLLQGALELGRQDLSWSVGSLLADGAVLDRSLSRLGSQAESQATTGGLSRLSDELLRDRAIRRESAKLRRASYVAGKASKASS